MNYVYEFSLFNINFSHFFNLKEEKRSKREGMMDFFFFFSPNYLLLIKSIVIIGIHHFLLMHFNNTTYFHNSKKKKPPILLIFIKNLFYIDNFTFQHIIIPHASHGSTVVKKKEKDPVGPTFTGQNPVFDRSKLV